MSRAQFWTLNLAGGVCTLLIISVAALGYFNGLLAGSVSAVQGQFNQAQQLQNTAQNLAVRVAQAGQREVVLRDLLARHDFKVNLNQDSQIRPAP